MEEAPELEVKNTVNNALVEAGDIVTYTLSVKNSGSTDLANIDINDVMPGVDPANFIDFNLEPTSTVGQAVGNVSIKPDKRGAGIVSFKQGEEAKFTYKVKIPDNSTVGKVWTNTATATAADGTTANDTCSVTVKAMTDKIVIDKTADRNQAQKNEVVKYRVTVKNVSSEPLNNVKVSDSLNITLVQKTTNGTVNIAGNSATIGTLVPNETVIFEYNYTVPASAAVGSKIENTAKAIDPKNKEYLAKKEVKVVGTPALTVKKTVDKAIVEAGDMVTYTLSVKNSGTTDLANVAIDDNMAGIPDVNVMSFALDPSSTVDQNPGNVKVKADKTGAKVFSLKQGKEAKFTYKVKIPLNSNVGKEWNNVTTATTDDGTTENDTCKVTVKAPTDKIVIGKTSDKDQAKNNETVKYTVTVKNISSATLNNVKVSDSLNVTLVQKTTNSTVNIAGNTATIGTLGANETVIFEYNYTVPESAVIGSKIENTAKAIDPNNKEYLAKKEVNVVGTPRLTVNKTVDKAIVEAGDMVTYTLSVKNSGTTDLANVVIDDNMAGIPNANVMSFALDPSSTVDQNPGNVKVKADKTGANVVSLKQGKKARFTYKVKIPVDSPAGKEWNNVATATADDGTTARDSSKVTVRSSGGSNNKIEIKKNADKNKAKRGEKVKYTVTVKNISSEVLNNVKVSDSLNVTLVQKTTNNTVAISGNKAVVGKLKANETVIFEYEYTVPASAAIGSKIENTAKAIDPHNREYIAKKEVIVDGNTPPGPGPGPGPNPNPNPNPKPTPKDETLLDQMKKHEHFAYMTGYPDRTFKPEGKMAREEVTVMFARLLTAKMVLDTKYDAGFYDVLPIKWSKDQIGYMREKGIVKGYLDGSFKPDKPVTRAEFAAIASRFDNLSDGGNIKFSDVDNDYWAAKYIYSAAKKGWITGYEDGTFRPNQLITRAEVVAVTNRMLDRIADKKYIDEHQKQIKYYKDLSRQYWAYYTIHEASNGHDYKRNAEGGEIWLRLWDLFIPNP